MLSAWLSALLLVWLWPASVQVPLADRLEGLSLKLPMLRNLGAWFGRTTAVEVSVLRLQLRLWSLLRLRLWLRLRLRTGRGSMPSCVRSLALGLPSESRAIWDLDAPR